MPSYTAFWFLGLPVKAALALQAMISLLIAAAACAVVSSNASYPLKAATVASWTLPFGLCILLQTQGLPVLPPVLMAYWLWLTGEALGWKLVRLQRATQAA